MPSDRAAWLAGVHGSHRRTQSQVLRRPDARAGQIVRLVLRPSGRENSGMRYEKDFVIAGCGRVSAGSLQAAVRSRVTCITSGGGSGATPGGALNGGGGSCGIGSNNGGGGSGAARIYLFYRGGNGLNNAINTAALTATDFPAMERKCSSRCGAIHYREHGVVSKKFGLPTRIAPGE